MQEIKIKKFKKVLVANRGEIAIRVYRALNELGIQTVGIFSKEDVYSLARTKADESYMLNTNKGPIDAYLDIDEIIKIAKAKMLMLFIRDMVFFQKILSLLRLVRKTESLSLDQIKKLCWQWEIKSHQRKLPLNVKFL